MTFSNKFKNTKIFLKKVENFQKKTKNKSFFRKIKKSVHNYF